MGCGISGESCISGETPAVIIEQHSVEPVGDTSSIEQSDRELSTKGDAYPEVLDPERKSQSTPDQMAAFSVEIVITKGNDLGLDVDCGDGTALRVTRVALGLVHRWNLSNPRKRIDIHDFIIEINGVKGDSFALLDQLRGCTTLNMMIRKTGLAFGGKVESHPGEKRCVSFLVQTVSDAKQLNVFGDTLGALRETIKREFGIPRFQQMIVYSLSTGDSVTLSGDDSVPLKEKPGLLDVKELQLSRQVDPRYRTEKQTAFLETLAACRFDEAKEILEDRSGASIDPNCVYKCTIHDDKEISIGVSECARSYSHPALTVAMLAGLEFGAYWRPNMHKVAKLQEWMSHEAEVAEVVALLIERRADVNAVGDETLDAESAGCPSVSGKSPLCAAVQRGSPTLVRMLLDAKADPNHTVHFGESWARPPTSAQRPEAYVNDIHNGQMSKRHEDDPRTVHAAQILSLLHGESWEAVQQIPQEP